MNHCIFVGNLVKDPQIDTVQGKKGDVAVTKFKIGVNNRQRNESTFPFCEAWGKGAEMIAQHFKRGDLIRVYCTLVTDTWEDKTSGETKYRDKFRVERFEFVESRRGPSTDEEGGEAEEGEEGEAPEAPKPARKPAAQPTPAAKPPAKGKGKTAAKPPAPEEVEAEEGDDQPVPF